MGLPAAFGAALEGYETHLRDERGRGPNTVRFRPGGARPR
jgi:hypothetical protein